MPLRSARRDRMVQLTAGLMLPSIATVLFNILGVMLKAGAQATIPLGAFDFSLGCAFTLVGAAVAHPARDKARVIFTLFCAVLLGLVFTDLILRYKYPGGELAFVLVSDALALGATGWALWD